jgi:hypothetical protein
LATLRRHMLVPFSGHGCTFAGSPFVQYKSKCRCRRRTRQLHGTAYCLLMRCAVQVRHTSIQLPVMLISPFSGADEEDERRPECDFSGAEITRVTFTHGSCHGMSRQMQAFYAIKLRVRGHDKGNTLYHSSKSNNYATRSVRRLEQTT